MRNKSEGAASDKVTVTHAILRALCYSDIFNYSLTKEQLWEFLIGKISRSSFERILKKKNAKIFTRDGYYCLSESKKNIEKRIIREKESEKKIILAKRMLRIFSFFPFITFIGITGSLALKNAQEKDDIDIFVITAQQSLWLTRLVFILGLSAMGRYRDRKDRNVKNKICLNMLIDESSFVLSKKKQNLYTAHEVVQLRPLFDKKGTHEKFLLANQWVLDFLPNSMSQMQNKKRKKSSKLISIICMPFNAAAKQVQLLFINKHKTTEIVSDHVLAFHPHDYTEFILGEYGRRVRKVL